MATFFLSQGRNPFFLEPSVIITITDGNKLTHSSGVPDEVRTQSNSMSPTGTIWETIIWLCVDLSYCMLLCHNLFYSSTCLSSCTCPWTLRWPAASWPKSPFVGTSVYLHWCWDCQEQPYRTTSSSAVSQQTTLPSPRCVKSPEVRHFLVWVSCLYVLFSFITCLHHLALMSHLFPYDSCTSCFRHLRAIILCADTEDVESVPGVSGPKSSEWCCD